MVLPTSVAPSHWKTICNLLAPRAEISLLVRLKSWEIHLTLFNTDFSTKTCWRSSIHTFICANLIKSWKTFPFNGHDFEGKNNRSLTRERSRPFVDSKRTARVSIKRQELSADCVWRLDSCFEGSEHSGQAHIPQILEICQLESQWQQNHHFILTCICSINKANNPPPLHPSSPDISQPERLEARNTIQCFGFFFNHANISCQR